jgi:LysR family transcriptional regulator for metE and metH
MIEIKHLKTLQALRNSGSLAGAAAACTRPSPPCLTSSAIWNSASASVFLCVKVSRCALRRRGDPAAAGQSGAAANRRALQDCNEPQQTRLRIAIECHSCIQWLTPALENFRARWPQVEMDFQSGVTFDPQPALQQGELDLVMTSDILPRSGLHYSPMFDYEVRLVLAPDHPLATKRASRRKIWRRKRC